MEHIIYCKEEFDNYIRYMVFSPDNYGEEKIKGPGGELIIERPHCSYEYLDNNINWERYSKRVKIKNIIGKENGQGVGQDGTLPLFDIFYTPPVVKILNSNKNFRPLSASLIMYAYIDFILMYNTGIVADQYASDSAVKLSKRFDRKEIKTINSQTNINKKREEDLSKFDEMEIEVEKNNIYIFDDFFMYCVKKEYKNRIFGNKYVDSRYEQHVLF